MKVFEKRDYQERIVGKASASLINGGSVLIESPTGSGKSYMAMEVIKNIADYEGRLNVVWVAHRGKLLEQGLCEAIESRIMDSGNINFTPLSSFCKDGAIIDSLKNADLLVFDEAQHSVSNTSVDLCHALNPKRIMGLSATPFRSDNIKLSFESVIRDAGINRLIKDGYLSKYDMFAVDEYTPEFMAKMYLEYTSMWGKTIAYWHTQEESDRFIELLHEGGINAKAIYGNMHNNAKERAIDEFESGEVPILSNLMLLTEGYDSPTLKTVFCKPSVKNLTIQMAGRALRIHPDKGVANIVQLGPNKGSDFKFAKIAHPRKTLEYHNGEWVQVGIDKDRLDSLHASVRREAAQIAISGELNTDMIGSFGAKRKKGKINKILKKYDMISSSGQEADIYGDQFDDRQAYAQ